MKIRSSNHLLLSLVALCVLTWLSSVWSVCTSFSLRSEGAGPADELPSALAAANCCTRASVMIMLDLNLCSSSCLGRLSKLPGGKLRPQRKATLMT